MVEPEEPVKRIDADSLLQLAKIVYAAETLESVLNRVAHVAKRTIPGAEDVSMTLIRNDEPFTAAYTGQLALDADEIQYERTYGPCMDAGRGGVVLTVDDLRHEERWPDYAAAVVKRGVLSSVSVPLPIQEEYIGALNVYSTKPHAFPPQHIPLAETIASYAAVALHNAQSFTQAADMARHLAHAMESRAVIEQAKGIIMEQEKCGADEAFAILTRVSQRANIKLRDIAAEMVEQAAKGRR
jgi:GAF domain-containing protein